MSQAQLDELFRNSPAGNIPQGEGKGTAIIGPGTELSEIAAKFVHLFAWQGKVFDPETGTLRNKILPIGLQAIIAKVYNLEPAVARNAVKYLLASHDKSGVKYWSGGEINLRAMNEMMRAQKIVGALKDDPDWGKIIDESFLPEDLNKKTN